MPELLDRLKTALTGRYTIERELGRGGMATVYLAHDVRYDRAVALKVLHPELTATLGAERFQREIQIAARLQHPHILPLLDSGEAAGLLYYVMPFVEGPTLRARLAREGELPIAEVVRILRDVVDGVAAAHALGVVHRDLKPENIMLSGRHAVVTDFGVAKALTEASDKRRLTSAGVALGTPAYMAPEQAAGNAQTDHRADIYALGVVAYEMLTGDPPFLRNNPQALLAAQMTEAPVPVTERRETVPPALASLVMRCLAKKPADRPQRAEELLAVLESLATPSGGLTPLDTRPVRGAGVGRRLTRRRLTMAAAGLVVVVTGTVLVALWLRSPAPPGPQVREPLVVLPFEVQGSDPGLAQLGVQAAEEIAAAIEGEKLVQVVRYRSGRGGEAYTERLGRRALAKAGAATLVTGVIGQRGDDIQVQARVIRGSDLSTVWTLGPERSPAADPTAALDALRERVLGAVGSYVGLWTEGWVNPGISQPAPSLDAFRLADKGYELHLRSRYADAIPLIRQAFARDTTWLVPAVLLEVAYFCLGRWQERDSVLAFLEARRERLYRGDALLFDLNAAYLASPEEEVRASLALYSAEPTFADIHLQSLLQARRPAEALKYYALRDTTLSFLPDYEWLDNDLAKAYHMLGRFADELAVTRAARTRQPRSHRHWMNEVRALAALGRTDEIEAIVRESHTLEIQGAPVLLMGTAATELSLHGRTEAARGYAERTLAGLPQRLDSLLFLTNLGVTVDGKDIQCDALRILGRYDEAVRVYDEESRRAGTAGLRYRILAMRDRILMSDTVGALALADSARTQPLSAYGAATLWNKRGTPLYFGAQILSLLGRADAAVDMLRQALNNGARLGVDEPLQWYWAPIKDYPPFQELVKIR